MRSSRSRPYFAKDGRKCDRKCKQLDAAHRAVHGFKGSRGSYFGERPPLSCDCPPECDGPEEPEECGISIRGAGEGAECCSVRGADGVECCGSGRGPAS